jgi:RNA polymerase sigma factor (sigma-70 family)
MNASAVEQFFGTNHELVARLYTKSAAVRWSLSADKFVAAIYRSYAHRFGIDSQTPDAVETASFLDSLHVEDLALAASCLEGNEQAWEHLLSTYRSVVERFARAAITDRGQAQEIADSIWADLYGLRESSPHNKSPLEYYHGRSSLAAWLRVVVARREADDWRLKRRSELLHLEGARNGALHNSTAPADSSDPDRIKLTPMLSESLKLTFAALDHRDRLRISYYYVQELTLAETAKLMGEHESTVSRNLARTRNEIRRVVERALRRTYHLSDDEIRRCFEYAVEDFGFDLAQELVLKESE